MAAIFEQRLTPALAGRHSLDPVALYRSLRGKPTACAEAAPFTAHVFACILSIGLLDAHRSGSSYDFEMG